jgi:hypothetical protein
MPRLLIQTGPMAAQGRSYRTGHSRVHSLTLAATFDDLTWAALFYGLVQRDDAERQRPCAHVRETSS